MNGFTENRASGASERPGGSDRVFTWGAGRAMLPLVRRIAADVVRQATRLSQVNAELALLERQRRTLAWPERDRRYRLMDEQQAIEKSLQETLAELNTLGVDLLDATTGLIGFPTVVNDRPAYFSWQADEEDLSFWNFANNLIRRPVPVAWTKGPRERAARSKGRPKK